MRHRSSTKFYDRTMKLRPSSTEAWINTACLAVQERELATGFT